MGFFKSSKPDAPAKTVRPIVVQPADLIGFSERLAAVERAVGTTDAAASSAIRALSESVGALDMKQFLMRGLDPMQETKRPWHWFASACELANAQGDYTLAPRVFNFMWFWRRQQDAMGLAGYFDMLLDAIPGNAEQRISRATAEAISHLPDDHEIMRSAHDVVVVGQIRGAVASLSGA